MGSYNLGDHFIFVGQFGLQPGDFLLQLFSSTVLMPIARLVKNGRTVFEKLLLPAIKHIRAEPVPVTDVRDQLFFNYIQLNAGGEA